MPEWNRVPLSCVLTQNKTYFNFAEDKIYPKLSVKLYGKGVVLDSPVDGRLLKIQKHQIAEAGQVILSEIWGKKGAIGIVPPEGAGALCTSHFFLFDVNQSAVDLEWLGFIFKANHLEKQLSAGARGTTGYAAVRPKHLLAAEIPLPPLPEQQRIVTRIKSMLEKVEEAHQLSAAVLSHLSALAWSIHNAAPTDYVAMRELVSLRAPDVYVDPSENYDFAGVYSFGRGVFSGQSKLGADFAYPKLTRLRAGDFTYPKLMAWEGALGVVPDECDGLVVSTEFPVFTIDKARVLPEVLDSHFKNPAVWPVIAGDSTGTNVRRRRLNPSDFLAYGFPLPDRATQEKIAAAWRTRASLIGQPMQRAELTALPASILARAFAGEL